MKKVNLRLKKLLKNCQESRVTVLAKTYLAMLLGIAISAAVIPLIPQGSYRAIVSDGTRSSSAGYQSTEWADLIPEEDLESLRNPPSALNQILEGSSEDSIDKLGETSNVSQYRQALRSFRVIQEFDNKKIRIPGFIVPIDSDERQSISSFFLVPYFGACLHLPPPPPNQIIYAEHAKGLKVEVLSDPIWVEGTIKTEVMDTTLGTSAYTMEIDRIEDYEE